MSDEPTGSGTLRRTAMSDAPTVAPRNPGLVEQTLTSLGNIGSRASSIADRILAINSKLFGQEPLGDEEEKGKDAKSESGSDRLDQQLRNIEESLFIAERQLERLEESL